MAPSGATLLVRLPRDALSPRKISNGLTARRTWQWTATNMTTVGGRFMPDLGGANAQSLSHVIRNPLRI